MLNEKTDCRKCFLLMCAIVPLVATAENEICTCLALWIVVLKSFCFVFSKTKCFICGIGSDYFDSTPHGFETHTLEEHNLANYM